MDNIEVFYLHDLPNADLIKEGYTPGWYYWFCFPGCLPDSDPIGPFETEDEAIIASDEE